MKSRHILALLFLALALPMKAQRERINFDKDWHFAFGHAADRMRDFGCATEYFTYVAKANSIHNEGPYTIRFKEDARWQKVDLPHDFVVGLPFNGQASYSHGFKTVGWKYPETSVGWYRKTFCLPESDRGRHFRLQFDGIYRDAQIWVNGVLVGHEPSGYIHHDYDVTPYLLFGEGKDQVNLVCVRADATVEEGWFYEGGGIYRHVWLEKSAPLHVASDGTFIHSSFNADFSQAEIVVETDVVNDTDAQAKACQLRHRLLDAEGNEVATAQVSTPAMLARQTVTATTSMTLAQPKLWSVDIPYLYNMVTEVVDGAGKVVDTYTTRTGLREVRFDKDRGLLLNGKQLKLKGFDNHQDHAGVGAAIPDGLQRYRIERLKWMGANAYRASHNPMTKEALDACDELGMLVFEENRLFGVNDFEMRVARNMIRHDRNHPCVFLWGLANEEWGLEWDDRSIEISRQMTSMYHLADPTRLTAVASASGPKIIMGTDVAGYNYILQNPVEEHRKNFPERLALGSEETTGCGTRGVYFPDKENGRMPSLNRSADEKDGTMNRIERGWRFYDERDYLAGVFYWTGFDYRGEPVPLGYPATGSQFGVLDYCGFPKDEAFYLKAWWRPEEPMVHILPHWNLQGHEGETVSVWAYSNCDEVELIANGKKLGRKSMPKNGHLEWDAVYQPGYVEAIGYRAGKRVAHERVETTGEATQVKTQRWQHGDIIVIDITLHDKKGRFVPTANVPLTISLDNEQARILGWGNGDSGFTADEQNINAIKTFNGCAQVIVQSANKDVAVNVSIYEDTTKELIARLHKIADSDKIAFAHQDDVLYGHSWKPTGFLEEAKSDVKLVCGSLPLVLGFDLGHLERGDSRSLDGIPFDVIRREAIRHFEQGGIVTMSWHARNPVTGSTAWDVSDRAVVKQVLENHLIDDWYKRLADFFLSLRTADGRLVPVLFRPWHEMTGSWFWWGQDLCSDQEYKALYRSTYKAMQKAGAKNLVYAFSTGSEPRDTTEFLRRYPGDDIVTVVGFDTYQMGSREKFISEVRRLSTMVGDMAKAHGKVAAICETGSESLCDSAWWTQTLMPCVEGLPLSYVLVWRNAHDNPKHFYAPWPGQESETDFRKFYKDKRTLFLGDKF